MSQSSPEVLPEDFLGRSVSDLKRAKRANNNGKLDPRALHPKSGKRVISVDKLNRSPTGRCTYDHAHIQIAKARDGTFYGWGYLTRGDVETDTPCEVEPDAIDSNPKHVLIKFPEVVRTCKKKRNEIAQELANLTHWLEYLDPTT